MDAVIRFGKWFRSAPVAAVVVAAASGCRMFDGAAEPPAAGPASVSGWNQGSAGAVARPQAPDAPAQPAAPVVPLSAGPSQTTAAPVVPYTPLEPSSVPALPTTITTPDASPPPTAPTPPASAGSAVVPVASTEQGWDQAATQVRVVAVIGSNIVITDDEIWQLVRQQASEYGRLTGPDRAVKEKEMFRKSLRGVIERELIIADFMGKLEKNKKPQIIEEVFDQAAQTAARQIKEFKKQNKLSTDDELSKAFRSQGLSLKTLQRQMERGAVMNMYLGSVVKEESKRRIGLAQIEAYYKSHAGDKDLRIEDRVYWNDLFVAYGRFDSPDDARKYAEGLLARVKNKEDICELAAQYGHGTSKFARGLGVGEKPGEIQPSELEPTVLSLNAGEVSGLVPTETGLHVVKVVERVKARVLPFDETTQSMIRQKLIQQMQEQERLKLIEDLWRKTTVKIVELPQ